MVCLIKCFKKFLPINKISWDTKIYCFQQQQGTPDIFVLNSGTNVQSTSLVAVNYQWSVWFLFFIFLSWSPSTTFPTLPCVYFLAVYIYILLSYPNSSKQVFWEQVILFLISETNTYPGKDFKMFVESNWNIQKYWQSLSGTPADSTNCDFLFLFFRGHMWQWQKIEQNPLIIIYLKALSRFKRKYFYYVFIWQRCYFLNFK